MNNIKRKYCCLGFICIFLGACIQNPNRYVNRSKESTIIPKDEAKIHSDPFTNPISNNNDDDTIIVESSISNKHFRKNACLEEPSVKLHHTSEVYIKHMGYSVSYNPETNIPNWVAWRLDKERLIDRESRTNDFLPDPQLDASLAVTTDDYKDCGWDRGHMCPAGDNKWHWKAMMESFYMTNICPQHHNLNRGDWKELEEACRRWADKEPVYIACGPILYKEPVYGYIGRIHKVRIPDAFFKVVLTGLETGNPRAIGFIYKNTAGNERLDSYINSIDQIERITRFDFFPELPDEIEKEIESQYDLNDWK